jgi:predicted nucleic acid-binding protein
MRIAGNSQHYMRAATRRARLTSSRLADAVHAATAQTLSCGFFVSHDRRLPTLDGMPMPAVNPFTLDDTLGS